MTPEQTALIAEAEQKLHDLDAIGVGGSEVRKLLALVREQAQENERLRNEVTQLVDDERRRWYRALNDAGFADDFEGLSPEVVARSLANERDTLRQQIAEKQNNGRSLRDSIEAYRVDMLDTHPDVAHVLGMLLEGCE